MKKFDLFAAILVPVCVAGLVSCLGTSAQSSTDTSGSATQTSDANCQDHTSKFVAAGNLASSHCENGFLVIESTGLSSEQMMVGITAWQQQVPLPQPYTGSNAWKIPLVPVAASTPSKTSGVGAVAITLNGVPIFNPSKPSQGGNQEIYDPKNDPKLIGELDSCGGHSGRGDDYHYHSGPVCFLDALGAKTNGVIGYALDGYKVLEFHDAGEKLPTNLDACNGHDHDGLGYHYHLTEKAPYVVGCVHGNVDNAFQPQTMHLRPPGGPLQATITALTTGADGWTSVQYTYNKSQQSLTYKKVDGCYQFRYPEPTLPNPPGSGTVTYCEKK
jgi:hypothetical protein